MKTVRHAVLFFMSLCSIATSILIVLDQTFSTALKPYAVLVLLTTGFTLIPFCDHLIVRYSVQKSEAPASVADTEEAPLRTLTVALA